MKKINIIGSYFGSDGYANHTRQFAKALNQLEDVEVTMSTQLQQGWHLQVDDEELKMFKRNPEDCDTILLISTPMNWKYYMCENKDFIGFLVWEGSNIPIGWIDTLCDERVKQIWVPSQHTKDAVYNTVEGMMEIDRLMDKVKIVPEGVDSKLFFPKGDINE